MEITVDTAELADVVKRMEKAGVKNPVTTQRMLMEIGRMVRERAKAMSPKSPTKAQYVATLKTGHTMRTKFTSGNLIRSIQFEVFDDRVEIGIASNTLAAGYAEKMHDERGKTWHNLGVGKQPESTDKFIFKAEESLHGAVVEFADKFVDRLIERM